MSIKQRGIGMLLAAVLLVGCTKTAGPDGAKASSGLPEIKIDGKIAGVEYIPAALAVVKAAYPQYAAFLPSVGGKSVAAAHPAAGVTPEIDWKWVGETQQIENGAKIAESDFQRETVWRLVEKPSAAIVNPLTPPVAVIATDTNAVSDEVIDSLVEQYEALKNSQGE